MALPSCIKTGSNEDRVYRDIQMQILTLKTDFMFDLKINQHKYNLMAGNGTFEKFMKSLQDKIKALETQLETIVKNEEAKITKENLIINDLMNIFDTNDN